MVKPKVGLSTLFCLGESFNKMVDKIVGMNVEFIEIVDDGLHSLNKKRVNVLKELKASHGFKYSVHAPFADINIASPSKPLLRVMMKRLKKSMVYANDLDCEVWVFHSGLKTGISSFYPGKDWLQNLASIRELCKFASDYGLMIAVENTPEPYSFLLKRVEDFEKFYSEFDVGLGVALDVGHANICGQTEKFLTVFRDKIVHLHVHDNDGQSDLHLGVGEGTVNWERVAGLVKNLPFENLIVVVESIFNVEKSLVRLKNLFS
ncbi:sugar phosphate isomerase/epimerase [Candidatus Bathyarchaeota archaeon]|nr:sugar phosphate isomerase/epimerase [Candidatus Bathyarchaeota archaeon]